MVVYRGRMYRYKGWTINSEPRYYNCVAQVKGKTDQRNVVFEKSKIITNPGISKI